ncbi:MAG: hypothetical protein UU47_C0001G0033 [candidate division TM6 bacterium GW2011_GWE2_41_16]|nr:MAG: hypothetical protein UU47_C0001G0033 [candidate division TM6 bacterium GW2011_GWE2_41_16]
MHFSKMILSVALFASMHSCFGMTIQKNQYAQSTQTQQRIDVLQELVDFVVLTQNDHFNYFPSLVMEGQIIILKVKEVNDRLTKYHKSNPISIRELIFVVHNLIRRGYHPEVNFTGTLQTAYSTQFKTVLQAHTERLNRGEFSCHFKQNSEEFILAN